MQYDRAFPVAMPEELHIPPFCALQRMEAEIPAPCITAGRRAVIRALPGPLSSPGWMVACTVYLFIVTTSPIARRADSLGENVRFCRGQGRLRPSDLTSATI
jgi:hypothetical protein